MSALPDKAAPSLGASFSVQRRVIGALLLREALTRYGRHNVGFLWLFFEPMMFTLGITAMWTMLKIRHSSIPVAAMALTGYSTVLLWRNAVNRCNLAIQPNLCLMYHRNVRVIDVFLARLLLEIAGATGSLIVLSALFISIGMIQMPKDVLLMAGGWGLLAWFAISLGLIIGSLSERSEAVDRVWHVLTYLLFGVSGAGFLVDWLPKLGQQAVLWLPMVHGVEMMRHGFFGDAFRFHYSVAYFASCNLLLSLIGLYMTRELGRRIEPE